MKNYCKIFALLVAVAAFAACNEEPKENLTPEEADPNQVIFTVGGIDNIKTKSTDGMPARVQTSRIALSEPGDPDQIYLIETVEDLDATYYNNEVDTKGVPVYTETFTTNFKNFSAIPYDSKGRLSEGYKSFQCGLIQASQNRYAFDFTDGWPGDGDLLFFMGAPANLENTSDATLGYSDLALTKSTDGKNGIISFNYSAPADSYASGEGAALLKDLLFTSKYVTKTQYWKESPTVLFYHTMAGVKFKSGNAVREGTETKSGTEYAKITNITKITVTNILSNGHCTVTPDQSYSNTNSNTTPSVPKSATAAAWDWDGLTKVYHDYFIYCTGVVSNNGQFPESTDFEGATVPGNADTALGQMNLNEDDFSNTFFFVPQTTSNDTKLTIEYTIGTKQYRKSVSFKGKVWEAGKLYTYTLSANHVAVKVTDDMVEDASGVKKIKQNLVMKNTGNVDVYIRAAVVGNWFDSHSYYSGMDQIAAPWGGIYKADGKTLNTDECIFSGLYGENAVWEKGADGYFYYTRRLHPGEAVPAAQALFSKATAGTCPMGLYATDAHLELEIMIQGFDANRKDDMDDFGWEIYHFSNVYPDGTTYGDDESDDEEGTDGK